MKHSSLKNVIFIIISALIIGGAFFFAEYRNKNKESLVYNSETLKGADTISPDLQDKDTDGDGLKDWEEVLLGTDPNNKDTDGDGTPDGKEVSLGRNPLVKAPNDGPKSISNASSSENEEVLTATDKIARDFFARYMELRQMGMSKDKYSQNELVGQVLSSGIVIGSPKKYTERDVIVTTENSLEGIKKYGDDVGRIFKTNTLTESRNEAAIAKDALDTENYGKLGEIDPIIKSYQNIISALLKVKTPSLMKDKHLSLVNSISELLFSATSLRKIDVDPVLGIKGLSEYIIGFKDLNSSINDIRTYLASSGISYSTIEGGSFFE